MIAPVEKLKKADIVLLKRQHCEHGHPYLTHYNCFVKKTGIKERIGFLDIEASNLKADFGYVFSYAIKELGTNKIYGRVLRPEELKDGTYDKNLIKEFIRDTKRFDRVITYYGSGYDIPFLRTRAVYWKFKDFPTHSEIKHTDLYYIVKFKFNFSRRKLQTVCDFFGIPAKGHPMKPKQWWEAQSGRQRALEWVWTHNVEDVISTELLYNKIITYTKVKDSSI